MSTKKGTPTDLNMYVFDRELSAGGGVISEIPSTSLPHMRRILAAGYIEQAPGAKRGVWVATDAGIAALERYRASLPPGLRGVNKSRYGQGLSKGRAKGPAKKGPTKKHLGADARDFRAIDKDARDIRSRVKSLVERDKHVGRSGGTLTGFDLFEDDGEVPVETLPGLRRLEAEYKALPELIDATRYLKPPALAVLSEPVIYYFRKARAWAVIGRPGMTADAVRIRVQKNMVAKRALTASDPFFHDFELHVLQRTASGHSAGVSCRHRRTRRTR